MQDPIRGLQKVNRREMGRRKAALKAQGEREKQHDTIYVASQAKLTRLRFMRNKLAVVGLVTLCVIYFIALFGDFLAPYGKQEYNQNITNMAPKGIHVVDENGHLMRPFVYEIVKGYDPVTFAPTYEENKESTAPVSLFAERANSLPLR